MSSAALCQRLVKDVCVPSAGRLTLPTVWLILYQRETSLNGLDFVACCSFRDMTNDIHTLNHTHTHTHADTHTRRHTPHTLTHARRHAHTHTHTHIDTQTHRHTDTDTHTHTHTHTCLD